MPVKLCRGIYPPKVVLRREVNDVCCAGGLAKWRFIDVSIWLPGLKRREREALTKEELRLRLSPIGPPRCESSLGGIIVWFGVKRSRLVLGRSLRRSSRGVKLPGMPRPRNVPADWSKLLSCWSRSRRYFIMRAGFENSPRASGRLMPMKL